MVFENKKDIIAISIRISLNSPRNTFDKVFVNVYESQRGHNKVYIGFRELAWRSGNVMDFHATVRVQFPVVFTELHVLHKGQ